jgi:hypothetical protein
MGRGVDSPGQAGGHVNTPGGQVFGESLGAIDPISGRPAGTDNSHLGESGIPLFPPYIKDGWRVEYLSQKTGVIGMEDIQNANSKGLRPFPLLEGPVGRPRGQDILGNLGRDPVRFQFFRPAVQDRVGRPKPAQERVNRAIPHTSNQGEAEHRLCP